MGDQRQTVNPLSM